MKMIVGLGNIGNQYSNTRHNTGFMAIDKLAKEYGLSFVPSRFQALIASGNINGEKVLLVKPTTLMNNSGLAVGALARYFKISPQDILVIQDDLSLPVGKLRLRTKGSAGGHNGIKSVIAHLDTDKFNRLKIGIGQPKPNEIISFVLGRFAPDHLKIMDASFQVTTDILNKWLQGASMYELANEYN